MLFGLGYIGRMVLEAIQEETPFWNRELELVGAVDILSESRSWSEKRGIEAFDSLRALLTKTKPDVCVHTTSSNLSSIQSQLKQLIEAKLPVVSSCEELFYPWKRSPSLAKELDTLAKKNNVALLGAGVNPGFIMDILPAVLTQSVQTVEAISIERVVDASTRRPPLQKKIGMGLDKKTFLEKAQKKKLGHVGLSESLDFLIDYLGWEGAQRFEKIEPIIATKTKKGSTRRGYVSGIHHRAWAEMERRRVIDLDLKIYMNATDPGDRARVRGKPDLKLEIIGGTPGDSATVGSLLHGIPIVMQARPGIVKRLERDHFPALDQVR